MRVSASQSLPMVPPGKLRRQFDTQTEDTFTMALITGTILYLNIRLFGTTYAIVSYEGASDYLSALYPSWMNWHGDEAMIIDETGYNELASKSSF